MALNKVKEYSAKKVPKQISEQRQQDLALELKGSTQRRVANKRKATRLTEEKKEIMDKCFDSDRCEKRKCIRILQHIARKKWKEKLALKK